MDRQELVSSLMDATTAAREMSGQIASQSEFCFKKPFLNAFLERPPLAPRRPVQELHIAVDPSGGGKSSDWAIVTIAYIPNAENTRDEVVVRILYWTILLDVVTPQPVNNIADRVDV